MYKAWRYNLSYNMVQYIMAYYMHDSLVYTVNMSLWSNVWSITSNITSRIFLYISYHRFLSSIFEENLKDVDLHAWYILKKSGLLLFAIQEEGWVVCRVFKKKNHQRGIPPEAMLEEDEPNLSRPTRSALLDPKYNFNMPSDFTFDASMHLPQLLSSESSPLPSFMPQQVSMNSLDIECSHNLMKLTNGGASNNHHHLLPQERFNNGDWSILDKLLASQQQLDQLFNGKLNTPPSHQLIMEMGSSMERFPLHSLGCENDNIMKFPK